MSIKAVQQWANENGIDTTPYVKAIDTTPYAQASNDQGQAYNPNSVSKAVKWVSGFRDVLSKYNSFSKQRGSGYASDISGGTLGQMKDLLGRYDDVTADMNDEQRSVFDEQYSKLRGLYDDINAANDYMNKVGATGWDALRTNFTGNVKGWNASDFGYTGIDDANLKQARTDLYKRNAQEIANRQEELSQTAKEWQIAKNAHDAVMLHGSTDVNDLEAAQGYYQAEQKYQKAKGEVERLENMNRAYELSGTKREDDDFALRQTIPYKNTDTTYRGGDINDVITGKIAPENFKVNDEYGLWLQNPDSDSDTRNKLLSLGYDDIYNTISKGTRNNWDKLKDDEVKTYYYILNNSGKEDAVRYLDSMTKTLNYRAANETIEQIEGLSSADRAILALSSSLVKPLSDIMSGVTTAKQLVFDGEIDPYSMGNAVSNTINEVRRQSTNDLTNYVTDGGTKNAVAGQIAGNTYQAIMSALDSYVGVKSLGQLYTPAMGMGAFAGRAQELANQGASRGEIAITATAAGVLEWLTEKYSIEQFTENFLEKNPTSKIRQLVNVGLQGINEASEEVASEVGNMIVNAIVLGRDSDNQKEIRQLMADGKSYEDAKKEAMYNRMMDVIWAGYGGLVSGAAMGGTALGVQYTAEGLDNISNYRRVGKEIVNAGTADQLAAQARSLQDQKAANKLAKQADKVASGKSFVSDIFGTDGKQNARKVGKVASKIYQQADLEQSKAKEDAFRKAAKEYIDNDPSIRNKNMALSLVMKRFTGTEFLPGQKGYFRSIGGQGLVDKIIREAGGQKTLDQKAATRQTMSELTKANMELLRFGADTASMANDSNFEVSDSGVPLNKETQEPVELTNMTRSEDGHLMFGDTAASEISYGNQGQALFYSVLDSSGIDAETASEIRAEVEGEDAADYIDAANALREAFFRGYSNEDAGKARSRSKYQAHISEAIWNKMYQQGVDAKKSGVAADQVLANNGERLASDGSIYKGKAKGGLVLNGITDQMIQNLTDLQRPTYELAKAMSEIGFRIELYASTEEDRTKRGVGNGTFRRSDGTICVDLNAGETGQGLAMYAITHEFTHSIKAFSPENFEKMAKILISEAEAMGIDTSKLMDTARAEAKYEHKGENLTQAQLEDIAYDEFVARACESVFTNTDAISRISAEIQNTDKNLWDHIVDFLREVIDGIKAYINANPEHQTAQEMAKVVQNSEAFLDAFVNAAVDTIQNINTMDESSMQNAPADVRESTRYNQKYMDMATDYNNKRGDNAFVDSEILANAADVRSAIAAILTNPEIQEALGMPPDITGKTFFADSSYGGTEENTTICPRSMGAEALLDAVSDLIGRPLTVDEQIVVSQEMQGLTNNPECVYCYVATDRKAYREYLGDYIKQRDSVLQKYRAGNKDTSRTGKLYQEFLNGRKDTNNMYDRFKLWIDVENKGSTALQASDLTSIERLTELVAEKYKGMEDLLKRQYVDAMKYAQSASWAKKREGYRAYDGHILKWKQSRINSLNSHYGLRMYSFSDFSPAFILENMQMITDASVRGLKMLAYTKDINFVKIFAKTGMNINVSCFGMQTGDTVVENNLQGASWDEAKQLREENPNVGVVFVAYNDKMVEWAMDQDWVDVVIPYHLVRTGTKVAEKFGFTNYTDISGDKKITGEWVADQDVKSITPVMHQNNKDMYLAACEANHLTPRFEKWINHPGYMKLVNETRRSAAETPAVQPVFDQRSAEIALQDMRNEGGYYSPVYQMASHAMEIAEKLQKGVADNATASETALADAAANTSTAEFSTADVMHSARVTDKSTLDMLENQEYITTYRSMQLIDGKLYPPMAAIVNGSAEDASELGQWEAAVEHPELIKMVKGKPQFVLNKGKGQGSIQAAYNPYMHSSNLVINDQFSGAYTRPNLVVVECHVPVSELTSGYRAQYAKDTTGWHSWHTGTVAGALRNSKGIERQVVLSRWIKPVRILSNQEVATQYKELLSGTDISVPDNVVSPGLLAALKEARVPIKESGRIKNTAPDGTMYSIRNIVGVSGADYIKMVEEGTKSTTSSTAVEGAGTTAARSTNPIVTPIDPSVNTELKSTRNSNGEQLSPGQQEYFRNSKVRDADGNLLAVFHGTPTGGFNEFMLPEYMSQTTSQQGAGYYFTDEKNASQYMKANNGKLQKQAQLYKTYLNITNPMEITEFSRGKISPEAFREIISRGTRQWGVENTNVDKILSWNPTDAELLQAMVSAYTGDSILPVMKEVLGYDGVKYHDRYGDIWVAWDKNQIKNTDNLNPTDSNDIRRSTRMSAETRAALADYTAQQSAISKAQKALYEQQRKDMIKAYQAKIKGLEHSYSAEVEDIQRAFFSLVRNYEAKVDEAGAATEQVGELSEALQQEIDSHDFDKKLWETEFSRLQKEYDKLKGKTDDRIGQLEDKVKQQREAAKAKVESHKAVEMRHRIQKTVNTLNRMLLNPTKEVHVPDSMQESVTLAMQAINGAMMASKNTANQKRLTQYYAELTILSQDPVKNADKIRAINDKVDNLTKRNDNMKAALGKLRDQYHNLAELGDDVYDETIDQMINDCYEAIGDTMYDQLSAAQLETVLDTYTAVLARIRKANQAFREGAKKRIDETTGELVHELRGKAKRDKLQSKGKREFSQFWWNNLKPVYAFDRIGSKVMSDLYNGIRKGEDTWYRDVASARSFFLGTAAKYGYDSWDFDRLYEFESSTGQKFELNLQEVMSLYAYSLRDQARDHLVKGGIVLNENTERTVTDALGVKRNMVYNDANSYKLTDEMIDRIANNLTPEQRGFAMTMQTYLSQTMGAKGNEVSLKMYDIKLFKEQFYWPLKSSEKFSERAKESNNRPTNKIKNSGFTKATVLHASNPVELSGFMDTWSEHINKMSMYHAFTLPMEDFYRVYNWKTKNIADAESYSVQSLLEQTVGTGAVKYIDQFLQDLNGGLRADPRETVGKAMMSKFKKGAVFASASVAIQQPSAIGRAFSIISPVYFVGSRIENQEKSWEQCKKYAPVAGLKEMGRFDMDMGRSTEEYIMGGKNTVGEKIDEVLGWAPEMADQVTWCAIWEAAKRQTAAHNPGLSGEALLQKAGDLFTECITRTQVYDSVFSRSANMRSKSGLMSMVTAFMAEPTTSANMIENAVRQWSRGNKRTASKAAAGVITSVILNSLLAAFVYAARDKDEDKTYWEKYLGNVASSLNPLGGGSVASYVPYARDIWSLLQGYDIERADMSLYSDAMTSLTKVINAATSYDDDASEEKHDAWVKSCYDAAWSCLDSVTAFFGLPVKNIRRDVNAIINMFQESNWVEMSDVTVKNAVLDAVKADIPIWNKMPKEQTADKLYDAIISGDRAYINRMKNKYADAQKLDAGISAALKQNDPRILEAARAQVLDDDNAKRLNLINEIVGEGNFTQNQVIKAINAEITKLKSDLKPGKEWVEQEQLLYTANDYIKAVTQGLGSADAMEREFIRVKMENKLRYGDTTDKAAAKESAHSSFTSSVYSAVKEEYAAGGMSYNDAVKVLVKSGAKKSQDDAEFTVHAWTVKASLGADMGWSDTNYVKFDELLRPAGITAAQYDRYLDDTSGLKGDDLNGDGVTDSGSLQAKFLAYIDSMPLTPAQKDALFYAKYPNPSKAALKKRPWAN